MGLIDRLLNRMDYEVLEDLYRRSLSENNESKLQITQTEQKLRDSEAELYSAADRFRATEKKLKNDKLFIIPANVRSKLFMDMLLSGGKEFEKINGSEIYLADRHSTVYELVSTIHVSNAHFTDCRFDGACFDNVSFSNVTFKDVNFNKANFNEVSFNNCVFNHCDFTGATGYDVQLNNCEAPESNINDMCLTEAEPVDEETQAGIDRYLYEAAHPEQDFEDDFEI